MIGLLSNFHSGL